MLNRGIENSLPRLCRVKDAQQSTPVRCELSQGAKQLVQKHDSGLISSLDIGRSYRDPEHPLGVLSLMMLAIFTCFWLIHYQSFSCATTRKTVNQRHKHKQPLFLDCDLTVLWFIKGRGHGLSQTDELSWKDQQSHDTGMSAAWTQIHHVNFREEHS